MTTTFPGVVPQLIAETSPQGEVSELLSCEIDTIYVHAFQPCQANSLRDWEDDTFMANVRVTFKNKPKKGWLKITGHGTDSVQTRKIRSKSEYIFQNVSMRADGKPIAITAEFTEGNCSKTERRAGDYFIEGKRHVRNAPPQCTVCGAVSATGQRYPSCWPDTLDRGDCNFQEYYAPDPNHLERTPIRYIRTVIHVLQKEDPDSVALGIRGVIHPADPGNYQDIPEHLAIIKSWFDDSAEGANGFLANLCDDPTDGSPWMKDARIRFLNKAEPGLDLRFHPDNEGWGTGYLGCYPGGPRGLSLEALKKKYVDTIADEEIRQAYHVFLPGAKWAPDAIGNRNIPDSTDCFYYCMGGYTNTSYLLACPTVESPIAIISGNYATYLAGTGQTSDPEMLRCAVDYQGNPAKLGVQILGEIFHILSLDHISPLQAHVKHDNGDDSCSDTPWNSAYNKMGCGGNGIDTLRCALTRRQLGRIHSFMERNRPKFERFPIDNEGRFSMTEVNCFMTDSDIVIEKGEDVVWKGRRNLRSNIVVAAGAKLTLTCDLGMPAGAGIVVRAGGELNIEGARIYSNCEGDNWEGIVLEKAPPGQTGLSQGILKMTNGAGLERANFGIRQ